MSRRDRTPEKERPSPFGFGQTGTKGAGECPRKSTSDDDTQPSRPCSPGQFASPDGTQNLDQQLAAYFRTDRGGPNPVATLEEVAREFDAVQRQITGESSSRVITNTLNMDELMAAMDERVDFVNRVQETDTWIKAGESISGDERDRAAIDAINTATLRSSLGTNGNNLLWYAPVPEPVPTGDLDIRKTELEQTRMILKTCLSEVYTDGDTLEALGRTVSCDALFRAIALDEAAPLVDALAGKHDVNDASHMSAMHHEMRLLDNNRLLRIGERTRANDVAWTVLSLATVDPLPYPNGVTLSDNANTRPIVEYNNITYLQGQPISLSELEGSLKALPSWAAFSAFDLSWIQTLHQKNEDSSGTVRYNVVEPRGAGFISEIERTALSDFLRFVFAALGQAAGDGSDLQKQLASKTPWLPAETTFTFCEYIALNVRNDTTPSQQLARACARAVQRIVGDESHDEATSADDIEIADGADATIHLANADVRDDDDTTFAALPTRADSQELICRRIEIMMAHIHLAGLAYRSIVSEGPTAPPEPIVGMKGVVHTSMHIWTAMLRRAQRLYNSEPSTSGAAAPMEIGVTIDDDDVDLDRIVGFVMGTNSAIHTTPIAVKRKSDADDGSRQRTKQMVWTEAVAKDATIRKKALEKILNNIGLSTQSEAECFIEYASPLDMMGRATREILMSAAATESASAMSVDTEGAADGATMSVSKSTCFGSGDPVAMRNRVPISTNIVTALAGDAVAFAKSGFSKSSLQSSLWTAGKAVVGAGFATWTRTAAVGMFGVTAVATTAGMVALGAGVTLRKYPEWQLQSWVKVAKEADVVIKEFPRLHDQLDVAYQKYAVSETVEVAIQKRDKATKAAFKRWKGIRSAVEALYAAVVEGKSEDEMKALEKKLFDAMDAQRPANLKKEDLKTAKEDLESAFEHVRKALKEAKDKLATDRYSYTIVRKAAGVHEFEKKLDKATTASQLMIRNTKEVWDLNVEWLAGREKTLRWQHVGKDRPVNPGDEERGVNDWSANQQLSAALMERNLFERAELASWGILEVQRGDYARATDGSYYRYTPRDPGFYGKVEMIRDGKFAAVVGLQLVAAVAFASFAQTWATSETTLRMVLQMALAPVLAKGFGDFGLDGILGPIANFGVGYAAAYANLPDFVYPISLILGYQGSRLASLLLGTDGIAALRDKLLKLAFGSEELPDKDKVTEASIKKVVDDLAKLPIGPVARVALFLFSLLVTGRNTVLAAGLVGIADRFAAERTRAAIALPVDALLKAALYLVNMPTKAYRVPTLQALQDLVKQIAYAVNLEDKSSVVARLFLSPGQLGSKAAFANAQAMPGGAAALSGTFGSVALNIAGNASYIYLHGRLLQFLIRARPGGAFDQAQKKALEDLKELIDDRQVDGGAPLGILGRMQVEIGEGAAAAAEGGGDGGGGEEEEEDDEEEEAAEEEDEEDDEEEADGAVWDPPREAINLLTTDTLRRWADVLDIPRDGVRTKADLVNEIMANLPLTRLVLQAIGVNAIERLLLYRNLSRDGNLNDKIERVLSPPAMPLPLPPLAPVPLPMPPPAPVPLPMPPMP